MKFVLKSALVFLLLVPNCAFSQLQIGMNFVRNYALHQYSKNIEQNPGGISITGLYHIPGSKFAVGLDWGASMYANENYTKELNEEGYPEVFADVSEENCYMSYQLIGRYTPLQDKFLAPYGEMRIGGASYFTERFYHEPYVENPDVDKPDYVEGFFEWNGNAFQIAAGGGVNLNFDRLSTTRIPLSLDLNINYVLGSHATYRAIEEPPVPSLDNSRMYNSRTNSYAWRVGVFYNFGRS